MIYIQKEKKKRIKYNDLFNPLNVSNCSDDALLKRKKVDDKNKYERVKFLLKFLPDRPTNQPINLFIVPDLETAR